MCVCVCAVRVQRGVCVCSRCVCVQCVLVCDVSSRFVGIGVLTGFDVSSRFTLAF